jgi:hypothetical protein
MPLTNAPDDSEYQMDVRIIPDGKLPQDLRVIRNGECIAKIYGEDAATPRLVLANRIAEVLFWSISRPLQNRG